MMNEEQVRTLSDTARSALAQAQAHCLPPVPQVLEVLMAYQTAGDPAWRRDVEHALALPEAERLDALMRLQQKTTTDDPLQQRLEQVHQTLLREVHGLNARLTHDITGNHRMADELRQSLRDLAHVITREELQLVCRQMVRSGRSQLDETRSLGRQLERSQFLLDELQRELAVLRDMASKDSLTGLANRRALDDRIDALLARATPFCMALLDLDDFKRVNDTFGHSVGDNILRGLAGVLREAIKGRDLAVRFGGEEFLLVLPDTPLSGALTLCEQIREEFGGIDWVTQSSQEHIGHLTLSCGVTKARPGDTMHTLFDRADRLLYQAKEAGKNRAVAEA